MIPRSLLLTLTTADRRAAADAIGSAGRFQRLEFRPVSNRSESIEVMTDTLQAVAKRASLH